VIDEDIPLRRLEAFSKVAAGRWATVELKTRRRKRVVGKKRGNIVAGRGGTDEKRKTFKILYNNWVLFGG